MSQPLAFLSYTRKDDEFFGGYITAFRKTLEVAVHVVSGEETFRIFQDVEGIVVGENWQKKLSEVIQESSFFLPMLSPLFFNSQPCREEVTEFLAHERSLARDDLILPVYFLSSAKLEKDEERNKDPIAKALAARQMFDWRKKANVPLQDPASRDAILELANAIVASLARLAARESFEHAAARPAAAPQRSKPEPTNLAADPRLSAGVDGSIKREQLSPRRILWVDDNPENNMWERRALESYGVQFALAKDTEQAREILSEDDGFAAVISDMGRADDRNAGITLLKWIREQPALDMPYFIYTSAIAAKRQPRTGDPQPQGITADPDDLVGRIVAALR